MSPKKLPSGLPEKRRAQLREDMLVFGAKPKLANVPNREGRGGL
jgi:hypothetical protein